MTEPTLGTLTLGTPVQVRVPTHHEVEYGSKIEHIGADSIAITAPVGAGAALLASGTRQVELSWWSLRGRYEQTFELIELTGTRLWRLRLMSRPVLIQRRRYVRVTAALPVQVSVDGDEVPGTTVDVSEGGFRVRVPRRRIPALTHATVQATVSGTFLALPGYVLRSTDVPVDETEAVIAFEADGGGTEAIRRFIFNTRLRTRAAGPPTTTATTDEEGH